MLKIIEKTKIWFGISATIIVIGIVFVIIRGLNYGIDFKGGTVIQLDMKKSFNKPQVETIVKKYASDEITNTIGQNNIEIKSNKITNDQIDNMLKDIKTKYKGSTIVKQSTIGATIGKELKTKAIEALIVANLVMLIYITIRFEMKFALSAILALVHDILILVAVYAIFYIPVNSGFIAALLTVVGYSVNDTIVVFDRIRENGKYMKKSDYRTLADASLTQTMARSINTVVTVLITITTVCIFVPSIRDFSVPLLVGIVSGCYSSIFIATPFWVIFKKMAGKKKVSTAK